MAQDIFGKILKQAQEKNATTYYQKRSVEWYRDFTNKIAIDIRPRNILSNKKLVRRPKVIPGRLYSFSYDPKTKETLPYYDTFPLVLPLIRGFKSRSFLGLNFHYLPPILRARLMSALYSLLNNKKFDDSTRIAATYNILKTMARFSLFRPCIKRYSLSRIRSPFIEIPAKDWNAILFLPVDRFIKAKRNTIWLESKASVANIKGK